MEWPRLLSMDYCMDIKGSSAAGERRVIRM